MDNIFLINHNEKTIEICIIELQKWFSFKNNLPVSLPRCLALKYLSSHQALNVCDNPEKYFKDRPMKQLIIRDAGIGDLLLLEPVIRAMKTKGNLTIDVLTRYPEVYDNNPDIHKAILQSGKESTYEINTKDYDAYDDLRSYSETSPNRAKKHRTDIYNEKFGFDIEDKEPRLYFDKDEKSILKKKKNFKYVGIQVDASHSFRKFFKNKELVEFIADKNFKVIILGDKNHCSGYKKHKNIIDMQGKTSIREAINIIKELDYMIAVDSGLMHIALTLHIPTISIFSIITPDFRMRYYTGAYKIITNKKLNCIGCGDFHMEKCKYDNDTDFIPPCMDLNIENIYNEMIKLGKKESRIFKDPKKEVIPKVNINLLSDKKLTLPIIVQDEEYNLPRFVENVINHPCIGRVIAIDGGSKDNTVKLLKKAGAEVYEHPYIKTYFNQQAIQREISFSYVKEGEPCIFFDIDECMNKALYDYLPAIAKNCPDYGLIARKTFNYYADINDNNKAIKDWPDVQPRIYRWQKKYKFSNGAHHITLNCPNPVIIDNDKYIIHFEKENGKRDVIEKQWSTMMTGVKQYA